MASFVQWMTSIQKKPEPRQITWVCGVETVLVEEVVSYVKDYLSPEPWNITCLVAGEDSERAIWSELSQHPLGSSIRLVIIRHAEKIKNWARFIDWVTNRKMNPRTYILLVSSDEKIPKTEVSPEQRKQGERPKMLPHWDIVSKRGSIIECRPFTSTTVLSSVVWVKQKVALRDNVARHLLERTNWNLRLVRDICFKLSMFPEDITIGVVNALIYEQPRDTFSDALLSLDRKTALLALRDILPTETGKTLGLLDARLDFAGMLHDMQNEHKAHSEMMRAAGTQAWIVKDVLPVAKHYSPKRRLEIRKTLMVADEAYRRGQTTGVLEMVVALW